MKQILVTGADGQLGNELKVLAKTYGDKKFVFAGKTELDITDTEQINNFFDLNQIDFCINGAAYTHVDQAETDFNNVYLINAEAAGELAAVCHDYSIPLFHISSDFVFDGDKMTPYEEADPTNPLNVYGQSKLEGEKKVMSVHNKVFLIRTSWVFSSFGKNFVKTMVRLGMEVPEIKVVYDQFGSPTYARDLAQTIVAIIDTKGHENHYGVYHYCNRGITSWYDFAVEIMSQIGSECTIIPIDTIDYPTPAKRPSYSALSTEKIRTSFDIHIPDWQESLSDYIDIVST